MEINDEQALRFHGFCGYKAKSTSMQSWKKDELKTNEIGYYWL